jgi:UDP-galactopyranose mutase
MAPALRADQLSRSATGQRHPHTVVGYEYPRADGEPYYPLPTAESRRRYADYRALAEHERASRGVYFAGRLATYAYLNMDQATEAALATFADIERDWLRSTSAVRHASARG